MKTLLIAVFAASSLFANAGNNNKSIATHQLIKNFTAEFGNVDNVMWETAMNNMTKAVFEVDDQKYCAYFDDAGNYVAKTKEIAFEELPKKLQKAVEEKAPGAEIGSVFLMESTEETAWFVETTASNERKLWKGNSFGKLVRYYVKH